jgi:tryptophan-rich sensory protein
MFLLIIVYSLYLLYRTMKITKITWNIENIAKLFAPMFLGYVVNRLPRCNYRLREMAGASVKFRPPAYVFGIVWPIGLLTMWIILYACMKKKSEGIYVLVGTIGMLIATMNLVDTTNRLLLTPLLTWIILALLLNAFEVQNS